LNKAEATRRAQALARYQQHKAAQPAHTQDSPSRHHTRGGHERQGKTGGRF